MTQVPVRVPVALLQVQVGLLTSQVYNYQYFGLVQAPQVTVPVPLVQVQVQVLTPQVQVPLVQVQYKYQHHKYKCKYQYNSSTAVYWIGLSSLMLTSGGRPGGGEIATAAATEARARWEGFQGDWQDERSRQRDEGKTQAANSRTRKWTRWKRSPLHEVTALSVRTSQNSNDMIKQRTWFQVSFYLLLRDLFNPLFHYFILFHAMYVWYMVHVATGNDHIIVLTTIIFVSILNILR